MVTNNWPPFPLNPPPPPIQLIYWFLTPVQIKKPAFYKSYLANFVSKKLGNSIGSHITGVLLTLRISDVGGVSSKIDSKLCARSSNQESSYYFSHKRRTKTNLSEPLALGCCCLPYYLHTMLSLNGLYTVHYNWPRRPTVVQLGTESDHSLI